MDNLRLPLLHPRSGVGIKTTTVLGHLSIVFQGLVTVINYMKRSAVDNALFRKLWEDIGSDFGVLLFYTSVPWLFAGNVLNRIFDLREELTWSLLSQGKEDFRIVKTPTQLEWERAYYYLRWSALGRPNVNQTSISHTIFFFVSWMCEMSDHDLLYLAIDKNERNKQGLRKTKTRQTGKTFLRVSQDDVVWWFSKAAPTTPGMFVARARLLCFFYLHTNTLYPQTPYSQNDALSTWWLGTVSHWEVYPV